ncbi:hypothetical protein niasHT_037303 [Heterodera trifolii]|uniref:PIPK domain-containing protein n=1 Tax=Heterodera trifolii TaxID=157864 RepID=A0ABD2J435_9BILA
MSVLLLPILFGIANAAGIGDRQKRAVDEEGRKSVSELCAIHEQKFKELFEVKSGSAEKAEVLWMENIEKKTDKEEEKEKQEKKAAEERMDAKNEAWLSTLSGNYLCQKLRRKGGEQKDEKLDYAIEKNVWTTPEKNSNEFNVRAEKLFGRIRDKNGISDEQLLMSLSALVPLKERAGSGGVFFKTMDGKFILKNLNPKHDEPAKMDELLDKYAAYVIDGVISDQSVKGEQFKEINSSSSSSKSMMNTMLMCFKMKLYAKLNDENGNERILVIRLRQLQFVVLNNLFEGLNEDNLLKFDIKGTFSLGNAVQLYRKECRGEKGWQKCIYREFDFLGISRDGVEIAAFFPEGIQLSAEAYGQLADRVKRDVHYLSTNGLTDYSLLLGVQFMDNPQPTNPASSGRDDDVPPMDTNIGTRNVVGTKNCEIRAICHNCKIHPAADTKYERMANLCLHMAIVDIVTPFNEKMEKYLLKILRIKVKNGAAEYGHYKSMSEFTPYHNVCAGPVAGFFGHEMVPPVSPELYRKRFVGTLLGCLFSPDAAPTTTEADGGTERQFKLGMRQSICKSFGERRGAKTTYGIEVFGMNMFKEMMEKRSGQQKTSAWEILNSFSDSLLPSAERSAEFVIEKIDEDKFFNFGLNANDGTFSPFFGLFSDGENYYAVVRNGKQKDNVQQHLSTAMELDWM